MSDIFLKLFASQDEGIKIDDLPDDIDSANNLIHLKNAKMAEHVAKKTGSIWRVPRRIRIRLSETIKKTGKDIHV